jgi:hypothetical protein
MLEDFMGCDMMLALAPATAKQHTLLGLNLHGAGPQRLRLQHFPAAHHPHDDVIHAAHRQLPQARQTCAVLGVQPEGGWGFVFGCNEHRLAIGVARWRSRLTSEQPGLTGPELTRLALERSHSAHHAVEVLSDLIAHHGHGAADDADSVFLIADPNGACVLEVADSCWALLDCPHTRAVADVGLIRQDWQRLSHGLAERVIQSGWWQDDGTKVDFAGCLGSADADHSWGLKRWSKATVSLAQQHGALDAYLMRRLLAEHFDKSVSSHALTPPGTRRWVSIVGRLDAPGLPLLWCARGHLESPVFFPLPVGVDLPEAWTAATLADTSPSTPAAAERLQHQFDQDAEEFLTECRQLQGGGEAAALRRLAQAMMQKHVEQWELAQRRRVDGPTTAVRRPARDEEMAGYAFG